MHVDLGKVKIIILNHCIPAIQVGVISICMWVKVDLTRSLCLVTDVYGRVLMSEQCAYTGVYIIVEIMFCIEIGRSQSHSTMWNCVRE